MVSDRILGHRDKTHITKKSEVRTYNGTKKDSMKDKEKLEGLKSGVWHCTVSGSLAYRAIGKGLWA